jgi:hypothetical protein
MDESALPKFVSSLEWQRFAARTDWNLPRQSRIVKAGEVLPQAPIPDHEKRSLKADASGIEVSPSTAAKLRT